MRFLTYQDLVSEKGVPYSNRQLKRLEAKGKWPKRVPLAGGAIKGWVDAEIDKHLARLTEGGE
jgi:predicted DNA-binding transcriptional regulator AlpA